MIGKMNKRVTVQELKTGTENAYNETDYTNDANWQTYCTRWAEIVPKGGREFRFAQQEQADLSLMLRMHSDRTTRLIDPRMRVQYEADGRTRTFQVIDAYDKDERRQQVEIKCSEVV